MVVDAHKRVACLGGQVGNQAGLAAGGGALQGTQVEAGQQGWAIVTEGWAIITGCSSSTAIPARTKPATTTLLITSALFCNSRSLKPLSHLKQDGIPPQQDSPCQVAQVALHGGSQHKCATAAVCGKVVSERNAHSFHCPAHYLAAKRQM